MVDLQRRQIVKGTLALAVGAATGGIVYGYAWERHALTLVHEDVPISGLHPALEGLRIGLLTDLHLSQLVPARDVERAVSLINAQRPDVILLGGDYVSFADRRFMEPVGELLSRLTAPLGVFGIVGNHDDERYMPSVLRRHGIAMLMDERTRLVIRGEPLELAGLKFWTKRLEEIDAVMRGATAPVLLLAHDPRRIVEAAALGVGGVLAGHTHGGQVVLPGLGAIAARKFPVPAGRLRLRATEMFVSRGVGTVYVPVRINCPPEVAVLTLRRPASEPRR